MKRFDGQKSRSKKTSVHSPGEVVMGDDSCSRGCGFESQCHILDGHYIFHIDLWQKMYCLFEKTRNKQKEAGVGPWPLS